jgi:hypothetical protein
MFKKIQLSSVVLSIALSSNAFASYSQPLHFCARRGLEVFAQYMKAPVRCVPKAHYAHVFRRNIQEFTNKHGYPWPQVWSKGIYHDPTENALKHFEKHRSDFPEYQDVQEYVEGAHVFMENPPEGTLMKVRAHGEECFYHPDTNTFACRTPEGIPKTMFRPSTGMEYWDRK